MHQQHNHPQKFIKLGGYLEYFFFLQNANPNPNPNNNRRGKITLKNCQKVRSLKAFCLSSIRICKDLFLRLTRPESSNK